MTNYNKKYLETTKKEKEEMLIQTLKEIIESKSGFVIMAIKDKQNKQMKCISLAENISIIEIFDTVSSALAKSCREDLTQ
jgi:hypothetical protein